MCIIMKWFDFYLNVFAIVVKHCTKHVGMLKVVRLKANYSKNNYFLNIYSEIIWCCTTMSFLYSTYAVCDRMLNFSLKTSFRHWLKQKKTKQNIANRSPTM